MTYTATHTHPVNYWLMPIVPKRELTADDIINAVCKVFNIPQYQLLCKRRKRDLVRARFVAFYVLKLKLQLSLAEIGRIFRRDHTTVIHGLDKLKNELSVPAYRQEINEQINAVINLL